MEQRPAGVDQTTDGGGLEWTGALGWLWLLPLLAAVVFWLRSRPWREPGGRVPTIFACLVLASGVVELALRLTGSAPSFSFTVWPAAVFVLALVLARGHTLRDSRSAAEPVTARPRTRVQIPPEAALDLSLEQAADAVACADLDGTVIYVNRAWADMHRMTAGEARGHHLSLFHTPEQMTEEVRPLIDEVLAGDPRTATIGHRRKDGTTIVAETSLALVRDAAGEPATLVAIARERHEREAEAAPAEPAAVEEGARADLIAVARSIAHDFNNLLTAVLGNASLALLQLPEDSKVRDNIEEIERVAQRANELSRRLQAHVHGNGAAAPESATASAAMPEAAFTPAPPSAGDTVLVVDNEKIIRDVATSILESNGYAVLTADDGAPAVALYRQRREDVGAILLDLTMPHMDGREALREIRRFDPRPPVILMTGHHEQDVRSGFGDGELTAFIQKPFRPDELLGTVRKVLTG